MPDFRIIKPTPTDKKEKEQENSEPPRPLPPPNHNLPSELLHHAQEFQNHMLYFLGSNASHPPSSLEELLNEILSAGEKKHGHKVDNRAKKEVFHDEDGKKVRVPLSVFG